MRSTVHALLSIAVCSIGLAARAQEGAAPPVIADGCKADSECKGDRICERGQCVAPAVPASATATATTVTPATAPSSAPTAAPPPVATSAIATTATATTDAATIPQEDVVHLSSERLFGFNYWSVSQKTNGVDEGSESGFGLSLLAGPTSPNAVPAAAHHVPRLGVDVRVFQQLTVGVALGYFHGESKSTDTKGVSKGGPNLGFLIFAPRVGYMIPLGPKFILWPRAGITYYGYSEARTDEKGAKQSTSTSGVAGTLEAVAVFRPIPHWGFFATLSADVGLAGSVTNDPAPSNPKDVGLKATSIGITGGGMVSF